jgi:pyrroloquinoline quinone (PQQ) biosynthesis protein C
MTPYEYLLTETAAARAEFLSTPLLARAVAGRVPRSLYIEFLAQAYHHVRHTCFLMSLAAEKTADSKYRAALKTYMAEEDGHEQWILDDITAMGGDADAVACSRARPPCRAMVGYAHYAIDWISPYSLLGMIHVLEGTSAELATKAANALENSFGLTSSEGLVYLRSHGALDVDHAAFFKDLINQICNPSAMPAIIDTATMMYWLYGNIFHDLEQDLAKSTVAAYR